ncbi:hypothetical protein SAMN05444159_7469 [Bradyrhizobium lablabi]|uniref:Uncharacterized protein n=1 Tax=Bradyrhizobium lablabi TaxID=722472 RepID=A0A1M7FDM0_9BRAD|nr:hypothetical protein SAMN05444159_7469 [Bradyrhizobium lablabi]
MRTDIEEVSLSGKTGSDRRAVKATRLTRNGQVGDGQSTAALSTYFRH